MNRAFKAKPKTYYRIPNAAHIITKKNGVTVSVKRVDLFECNECEDDRYRCYCLAA